MKTAIFQYDIRWEDKEYNKKRITTLLGGSDLSGVEWIIFPETTLTGFSMDVNKTALKDEDISFFSELCRKRSCYMTFGAVVDKQNMAITMDKAGKIINEYKKIHQFDDERNYYVAGKTVQSFSIGDIKIQPTVCYDLRFSYLYWDKALESDVSLVIANWPEARREHWMTLLRARAIENQTYVIGVNRIGKAPNISYSGDSKVFDPFGKELLDCGSKEGVFIIELSKGLVVKVRQDFPVLRDRVVKKS